MWETSHGNKTSFNPICRLIINKRAKIWKKSLKQELHRTSILNFRTVYTYSWKKKTTEFVVNLHVNCNTLQLVVVAILYQKKEQFFNSFKQKNMPIKTFHSVRSSFVNLCPSSLACFSDNKCSFLSWFNCVSSSDT